MYVIAGLGNPDKKYEKTRHNVGFDVIDTLAEKYNISVSESKHRALCGRLYCRTKGIACQTSDLHEPKRREYTGDPEFL